MRRAALLLGVAASAAALCIDENAMGPCEAAGCLWDTMWFPNLCSDDPCKPNINEQTCHAVSKEMPFPCSAPAGDPDFCIVEVCHYDPRASVPCQLKSCLYPDQAGCSNGQQPTTGGTCAWKVPAEYTNDPKKDPDAAAPSVKVTFCAVDYCLGQSQPDCVATAGCEWAGFACARTVCGELPDEMECAHSLRCKWDSDKSPSCTETECSKTDTEGPCTNDAKCMWSSNTCVPKTCNKYNSMPDGRCKCSEDPDCIWHTDANGGHCNDPKYNSCPDLDIAFVLDGSGSMRRSFGRHPHGFFGLMEILREWVATVPLTGDNHLAGSNAKTNTGAFRMTFIQFSIADATPAQDHPTGCDVGKCTSGLLSGDRDELNGDIDWHEANYQAQWTYLHDALQDVADHTFLPTQSPPGRGHVVIIIADGGITDIDGDACCETRCGDNRCVDRRWLPRYKTGLEKAQQDLRNEDVTVFGIVMRRFDYHTFQDENAEVKLTPLVTEPVDDHFMNLPLDEIPGSVLNTLCDPNSKFGKLLVKSDTTAGCVTKTEADCATDAACQWDASKTQCSESVCYPLCDEPTCNGNPLCLWSGDRCDLKPPGCAAKDEAACKTDDTCLWDPLWADKCIDNPCIVQKSSDACAATSVVMPSCTTDNRDPDFCTLGVCEFGATNTCQVKKCLKVDKTTCEQEPDCVWNGPDPVTDDVAPSDKVGMCNPKACLHGTQMPCDSDALCKWDGMTCVEEECPKNKNEPLCDKNLKCHWDVTASPAVCKETECAPLADQMTCDASPKCMWQAPDVCVPKTCTKHKERCPCDKDADCVWHHSVNGGFCADPQFNKCPDLDIAFVLDGSGSMRRSFGRHPHGFFGLMEILRDWMKIVPLTGDNHLAGSNAKTNTGAFRMTFIQFSIADATPAQDHPTTCIVGQCTNGLLSGDRDELNGDIDWHEANYQAQWTYLHKALQDVADHTFLPTQSPPGRGHVVIIIADGGITDIDGDACCETRCGDDRCVDRRWQLSYKTDLDKAQQDLRDEDVTVFGIVMRRFDYHTFQDENAEAKLTPLVSTPTDTHFMNLQLDEIPGSVLNSLCDPNSKFGKLLVQKPAGCAAFSEAAQCAQDTACLWENNACVESECYPLCEQATCDANLKCQWGNNDCVQKPPGCLAKDEADCKNDDTCLWDPLWADKCIDNPCRPPTKETDCHSVGVTMPDPCVSPAADPDFCKLDVCEFDPSKMPSCEVKKCLKVDKTTCEQEPDCVWNGPDPVTDASVSPADKVGMCNPKACLHGTQMPCDSDPLCKWDGMTCVEEECPKNKNEPLCDKNLKCHWDVTASPAVCKETECAPLADQMTCDASPKCMWQAPDVCVPKTCTKHKERCPCDKDADCVWHHSVNGGYCADPQFNKCPDLDIAFVLDGSGSMRRSFGRHPHGFFGLMEILRDWMKIVPLTGDNHLAGSNAKTNTGAFRMTFIQFSMAEATPDQDHPTGCAVGQCTNGLLSGDRDELNGDIDWHEENYQAQWTYLHDALKDVADHTFLPTQSPPGRGHVVIIIADGGITDIDGDACCEDRCQNPRCIDRRWKSTYPGMLDEAQNTLRAEDVTVFGIVMRRFDYHTFQDENAEVKLTPLVTLPTYEHFMNLQLDEIPGSVLNTLCDPNSKFGKVVTVATGCSSLKEQAQCAQDTACLWENNACVESECYPLCEQATCDANLKCQWGNNDCVQKPPGCLAKDEADCKNDDTCLWDPLWADKCIDNPCRPPTKETDCHSVGVTMPDPCVSPAADPDFCKLDVCEFDPSKMPSCEVKKCLKVDKTTCEQEPDCVWNGPDPVTDASVSPADKVGMCNPKACLHGTQMPCDSDPLCKWDGMTCVEEECPKNKNELSCDKNLKCHWDVTASPAVCKETECAPLADQMTCDASPKCMWQAPDVCVPKTCKKHSDRCDCQTDPGCLWHHGAGGGYCADPQFNKCPDLDIAFVLDGSGSMRRSFGRHPHGFFGLMEILREWLQLVPLTGDNHLAGAAGASRDKGFRMTFIQFSMAEATAAQDHPTNCLVGQCTSGLLSGDRDELNGDITWHEANYQAQWTYLHDALLDVAEHTFLPSQSPPWRQNVVIIIADGGITDIDGDACCEDRCGNPQCMDRRWKGTYPGILDEAQNLLRTEGVTVFGIVMRRFDHHTFQDENAEAKLKPLISNPREEHFMNLPLDDIPGSVLNTLCDPNSKFGQKVSGNPTSCVDLAIEANCTADAACVWDGTACAESVCYPLCTKGDCDTNTLCYWSGDECLLTPVTPAPATDAPTTVAPPTPLPATDVPVTAAPPTGAPVTQAPPTAVPDTPVPDTPAPTPVPTPVPAVDECLDNDKNTVCTSKGQLCRDPDHSIPDNWMCSCPPPATGTALMSAVADCTFDECQVNDVVCVQQGQHCFDTKKDTSDDWECRCEPPQTGTASVGTPAVCIDPPGDCEVNGPTCHAAGQKCLAGDDKTDGQFECECLPPSKSDKNGANSVAICTLDECVETCPTCAQTATNSKNVCTEAGQECEDLNTGSLNLRDWRCKCKPPQVGAATMAPAVCTLDECKEKCSTCADTGSGNICTKAGQTCVEHSIRNVSDWECVCVDPKSGRALTKKADCTEDECRTHEDVCIKAGQSCVDPDSNKAGDWECRCPPPSTTASQAQAAQCEEDECSIQENKQKCEDAGQTCVDPDAKVSDNWECHCPAPSTGKQALGAAIPCTLDECTAVCPTCARTTQGAPNVCESKNQTCHDPVTTASSLSDWSCTCKTSSKSAVTAAVAQCVDGKDECIEPSTAVLCRHRSRYSKEGCLCACDWTATFKDMNGNVIPLLPGPGATEPCTAGCCNPQFDTNGDWCYLAADPYNTNKQGCQSGTRQSCTPPGSVPTDGGKPAVTPPTPGIPSAQSNVCTDKGQLCMDPDQMVTDDWQCKCLPPKTGAPGMQAPAECVEDECAEHGADCHARNQNCVDPDTSNTGDWYCQCKTGTTTQPGGPAECPLDECKDLCPTCASENGTDVCAVVGQVCEDPGKTDSSLNDWMCKCPPPSTGSNVGGPVDVCLLDECTQTCPTCAKTDAALQNVCTKEGQTCEDPKKDSASTNDWMCKCPDPSNTIAIGNAADCETDECDANGDQCHRGQMCLDPDQHKDNDWYCECLPPSTGSQTAGPAVCLEDECKTNSDVCAHAGQLCQDSDKAAKDSWVCTCLGDDKGVPANMKPAKCQPVDECRDGGDKVCASANQHCVASSGQFQCECIAPYKGTAKVGAAATDCTLDECVDMTCASCAKGLCEMHNQVCEDPDTTKTGDWVCKCTPPATGNPLVGAAAVCVLDECEHPTCASCEKEVCTKAGQTCIDPSTSPKHTNDWMCVCPPPSTNTKTAGAVLDCTFDECTANSSVCLAATQICVDPDTAKVGDWECHCKPPASGSALQAPAAECLTNECTATCVTCADKGKGNVCTMEEQKCVDPDHSTPNNWYCKCPIGSSFQVGGVVPECVLDECKEECTTCANKGGGNICEVDGQTCVDVNTASHSVNDWQCRCPPPLSQKFTTAGLALCGLDECTEPIMEVIPGHVCTEAGQLCHDSHLDTLGDFDCVCPPPKQGTKTASPATCTTDECLIHGDKCGAGQTCNDPNLEELSDWECVCPPPSGVVQKLRAATCEVDECVEKRHICEEAQPPQQCVDTNKTTADTWVCRCIAPSSGSASQQAASCVLDECEATCATCENNVCRTAGQTCVDPNTAYTSLHDWMCKCAPPSTATAIANAAACPVDECERARTVCEAGNQVCIDPDTQSTSLSDWECHCQAPAVGKATKGMAQCLVDECKKNGHVCSTHGQICMDPHKGQDSLNDWQCKCPPPLEGAPGAMKPAECKLVGECEDPVVSDVCTSVGQLCFDPDEATKGNWQCLCITPATGVPGKMAPAACVLDECVSQCATCAGTTCTDAGQSCVDPDKNPLSGLNSWVCRCLPPASGSQVGMAAECNVNECDIHRSTCTTAGQDCIDPDTAVVGDWRCECKAPGKGQSTGSVASCIVDECDVHGAQCTDVGQTCYDPDKATSSQGDWTCQCIAPWTGSAIAQKSNCTLDECDLYGDVCRGAGQTCVDDELNLQGFWKCVCPPPNEKTYSPGKVANCQVDECTTVFGNITAVEKKGEPNKCEKAGQECFDPDQEASHLGNWVCKCKDTPTTAVASVAMCELDECTVPKNFDTCVGQLCVDPKWTSSDDWECRCPPPMNGNAVAALATCIEDECAEKEWMCHEFGQVCKDPDTTKKDTWECHCPEPLTEKKLMGEADCTPKESECAIDAIRKVCSEKGQACFDPDVAVSGNWRCECLKPATGAPGAGEPAVCVLDECKVECTTCAGNTCSKEGQTCYDPNTDGASLHDWLCRCADGTSGSAKLQPAVCILDECAEICHTCADHGGGNVCARTDTVCYDPNKDARSVSDWMCMCKPPATGNRTLGIPVCILDECITEEGAPLACGPDQKCSDPNTDPTSRGDFVCVCPDEQTGSSTGRAARCILNECNIDANFQTCEKAGQVCIDPSPMPGSRNDWECHCAQGGGLKKAGVAQCDLDECTAVCQTCANQGGGNICQAAGQVCEDPNPSMTSKNDWRCKCASGTGVAVTNVAVCLVDECDTVGTCPASQKCVDPKKDSKHMGDWRCECVEPSFGEPVANGPATCMVDECRTHGGTCGDVGQQCVDGPGVDDWKCVCPKGSEGEKLQGIATCTWHGECVIEDNSRVCTQVGQACFDPNTEVDGDWVCQCVDPALGVSARGGPAACQLNECTARCPTCADRGAGSVCEAAGQRCEDASTSPSSLSDWRCVCPDGVAGSKALGAALCLVDECIANNGRLAQVCGAAGQTCVDPSTSAADDWKCECPKPAVGEATRRVAACTWDECLNTANHDVCANAGQKCVDPNTDLLSKDDWYCQCIEGTQTKVMAPATCTPGSWCSAYGQACTARGQLCVVDPSNPAKGRCECSPPQTGTPAEYATTGVAAQCMLDECNTVCDTCASTGGENLCVKNGQSCVEGSTDPLKTRDWRCVCPLQGTAHPNSAVAASAECAVNECDTQGVVCRKEEQRCIDPDSKVDGDWFCECFSPAVGKKIGGAATCKRDECQLHEKECAAVGQTCFDPDMSASKLGDWECHCPSPATGKAVAKTAQCTYTGDCADAANAAVCEKAGQTCYDPDTATVGDWECRCVNPQVGEAKTNAPAVCILDECRVTCETCATKPGSQTHACLAAEQECVDPNTDPASNGDWRCKCPAPAFGEQRAAAAQCELDECSLAENKRTCSEMVNSDGNPVQMCVDVDRTKLGDWQCQCSWPYVGEPGNRELAACRLDECIVDKAFSGSTNGNEVCSQKGQTCVDPNQDVGTLGDWLCQCPDPNDGSMIGGPVATCKQENLCSQFGDQCGSGQMCVEKNNDWYCACTAPLDGEMLNKRATCILDECTARCATCAQKGLTHTCTAAEQSCVDRNKSPESVKDWSCVCTVGTGEAVAAAAECTVDECADNEVVCAAVGQNCEDPKKGVHQTGDWMCLCPLPSSGFGVAGAAACVLDECITHGQRCTEVGQQCIDQDKSPNSKGDWTCNCPAPAKGTMVGGVATCAYIGGCDVEAHLQVCTAAEQKCVPGANSTDPGMWRCACLPPFHGEPAAKQPAKCLVNECDDICPTCARSSPEGVNVCTAAGQGCVDPDMSMEVLSDWMCRCIAPATATAVGKAVETCLVDECLAVTDTGARQCGHFTRYTNDGCECACDWVAKSDNGAFLGTGPGFSEPCSTGCCNPDRSADGDWCFVADTEFNRKNSKCVAAQRQTCADIMKSAPEGAPQPTFANVCAEKGQVCVDRDHSPTVSGDWECRCADTDDKQDLAWAVCEYDECKNVTTCLDAGQQCRDANTASDSRGDWECLCASPATGSKQGGAADCTYPDGDECKDSASKCGDGQYCFDEDSTLPDNWECRCAEPLVTVTKGVQGPATCHLDECSVQCKTCADKGDGKGFACLGVSQRCVDPDMSMASLGDWKCECVAPATGASAVASRAICEQDECTLPANANVCPTGQECHDPSKSGSSLNDWMCVCVAPKTGSALTAPAVCAYDECLDSSIARICSAVGQVCFDPDTHASATGDWKCKCPKPSVGEGEQAAAVCIFTGECQAPEVASVCTSVGQTCFDPDVSTSDDWVCQCVSPQSGTNGKGKPARCGTDECIATCPTCELGACTDAGQLCEDPDLSAEGDWVCKCKAPQEGSAAGKAAQCTGVVCGDLDEAGCSNEPACVYDSTFSICGPSGGRSGVSRTETLTLSLTLNESLEWRPAGNGDDDDCLLCWLLPLLLLLCLSCCLLAFLLLRRRQQANQTEEDDEKWNKQFEAQVDGEDEELGTRAPTRGGLEGDHNESLLNGDSQEMRGQDDDDDI